MASIPERGQAGAFAGYAVGEVVTAGLAGSIRAARQPGTGLEVAIEEFPSPLTGDAGFEERLIREAGRAAALRHPSIIAVRETLSGDGRLALVTEWFSGVPLADLVGAERLSVAAALAVCDEVLGALAAAHKAGVVHGAVRAEAVVVEPGGQIRLGGFAVGRALDQEAPAETSIDTLGVARLAVGLAGATLRSRARQSVLPRTVRAVLRRGMAAKPDRRYRTASGMRTALGRAAATDLGPDWREAAGAELQALAHPLAAPPPAPELQPETEPRPPRAVEPLAPVLPAVVPGVERAPSAVPIEARPPRVRRRWRSALVVAGLAAAAAAVGLAGGLTVSAMRGATPAAVAGLTVERPLSLQAQPVQGSCNAVFVVTASGLVRGQGTLVYRWERSDGLQTENMPLAISASDGAFRITEHWQLSGTVTHPAITFRVVAPAHITITQQLGYTCP